LLSAILAAGAEAAQHDHPGDSGGPREAISAACAKDPAKRFQHMDDLKVGWRS